MSEERIPDEVLQRMVEANMVIVPTLAIRTGAERELAIENLERFVAAGGSVVYGTDLGNAGPRPGIDPREIEGMTDAGFTAKDIIVAATSRSARWLGLSRKGAIEPGMDADVIGVAGDPLADATALTNVRLVLRAGVRAR